MMKQRRLRAALGERAHEVERGRVGPVQILESEHDRLATARPPEPTPSSPPIAFAAALPARNSRARPAVAGCRPAARAGARIRPGRDRSAASVSSRSARRCSAGASAPNRWRPHSAIGCSGVFCNSCDALHSTQVCGVSPSLARNSSTSRDLPMPGSPTIEHELAFACPRALPAARQQAQFLLAADEWRQRPRAARRPPPLARTMRKSLTGSDTPLSSRAPLLLRDEEPGDLALNVHGDEHRARLGAPARARRRSARRRRPRRSRRPPPSPHSRPMRAESSGAPLPAFSALMLGERALDRQRGAHRALGVVLLRLRIAEIGKDFAPATLADHASMLGSRPPRRCGGTRQRLRQGPPGRPGSRPPGGGASSAASAVMWRRSGALGAAWAELAAVPVRAPALA